jgi:hypothetical protein
LSFKKKNVFPSSLNFLQKRERVGGCKGVMPAMEGQWRFGGTTD